MSQAGIINVAGGGGGGTPVQTITTPDGTATPTSNQILIDAFDSAENNDNGITTKAGTAAGSAPDTGTGAVNEVSIYLTNRMTGIVTTTTDTLTTIITFPLGATPGTFKVWGQVVAFDPVNGGGSYDFNAGYRTDGATATELGIEYHSDFEDPVFIPCDIFATPSGNNVLIQVQGLPAGAPPNSINWSAVLEYRKVN